MSDERLELIIDSKGSYLDSPTVFHLYPEKLPLVAYLEDKVFDSVLIKNIDIDLLTSNNFKRIIRKLKINGEIEVIICHPLTVMHPYEGKHIEANAKLAGFDDLDTKDITFMDGTIEYETVSVRGIRPEKNPNEIEVEVSVTGKEKVKTVTTTNKTVPKGKTTVTTTTTTKSTVTSGRKR